MRNVRTPNARTEIEELKDRLDDLERRFRQNDRVRTKETPPFSQDGVVEAGDATGPWVVDTGGYIVSVVAALSTADTADVEVDVLHNGASVGTVTIPAGETLERTYLGQIVAAPTDTIQVQVTDAGDGVGTGLTVQVRMKG